MVARVGGVWEAVVGSVSLWPLTSRASELNAFEEAWGTAHCRSVVVCGPPGVGKTRLAEECTARAARGGVVLGRATATSAAALAADDPGELLAVADDWATIGADLHAAEAATAAAAAYTRAADPRRATAATHRAQTHLARCGNARTPLLAAGRTTAALTTRERDVALAAARGVSSQRIAELLNLSVRTVENHLYRAYAKLGVTGRRELAEAMEAEAGP